MGRFHAIDKLSELQFGDTPYHFGYNNPVYFGDPTGLCPECPEEPLDPNDPYFVSSHGFLYHYDGGQWSMVGGELDEVVISTSQNLEGSGGGQRPGAFTYGSYMGPQGIGDGRSFSGIVTNINLNGGGNAVMVGSFVFSALSDRAAYNATYVYKYGTATVSAAELTAKNAAQMTKLSNVAGSISSKVGVAGILMTIGSDMASDTLGAGTLAKTTIGVLSVAFPGFGLAYGFADVVFLATTGTSLTTHIGNAVDDAFKQE